MKADVKYELVNLPF